MTDSNQPPSKSAKKRELKTVQALAQELVALNLGDLNSMTFDDEIRREIDMARKVTAHNAKRRQIMFLSRCLNGADLPTIRKELANIKNGKNADNDRFHELEEMRDRLLTGGVEIVTEVVARFPHADAKEVTKLQAQAQRDQPGVAKTTATRALFRYLRRLSEEKPSEETKERN